MPEPKIATNLQSQQGRWEYRVDYGGDFNFGVEIDLIKNFKQIHLFYAHTLPVCTIKPVRNRPDYLDDHSWSIEWFSWGERNADAPAIFYRILETGTAIAYEPNHFLRDPEAFLHGRVYCQAQLKHEQVFENGITIPSEIHTIDNVSKVWVDALNLLETCEPEDIHCLEQEGWMGCHASLWFQEFLEDNSEIQALFEYSKIHQIPYKCSIDGESAMEWLSLNRPETFDAYMKEKES